MQTHSYDQHWQHPDGGTILTVPIHRGGNEEPIVTTVVTKPHTQETSAQGSRMDTRTRQRARIQWEAAPTTKVGTPEAQGQLQLLIDLK